MALVSWEMWWVKNIEMGCGGRGGHAEAGRSVGNRAFELQLLMAQLSWLLALFAACRRSASQEIKLGRKLILLKDSADAPRSYLLAQTMAWVQRSDCFISCRAAGLGCL